MDSSINNPLLEQRKEIKPTRKSLGSVARMENSLGTKRIKRVFSDRVKDIVMDEFLKIKKD